MHLFWAACRCVFKKIIYYASATDFKKKAVLKNFAIFTGKLQAYNFIKNILQFRYFPLNIAKFLRTPISKNICSVSSCFCIDSFSLDTEFQLKLSIFTFWTKFAQKGCFWKSEQPQWILQIRISLNATFQLKLIILFLDQICPKRVFQNRKSEQCHWILHTRNNVRTISFHFICALFRVDNH